MNRLAAAVVVSCSAVMLALGSTGCDKGKGSASTTKTPSGAVIPATYFASAEPTGAQELLAVKKAAKVGDDVVMVARIAGRKNPFTSGRAEFMVTDLSLPICEEGCKVPWDHCCEEATTIAANAATVQLVENGEVIKSAAEGQHGLVPNAHVVVVGKVAKVDDAGNMVIGATQIFVKKS